MKYKLAGVAVLFSSIHCLAQSTAGLTGQRDTSYGNQSAYESTKKTHPNIRLVTDFVMPSVAEQKNIIYHSVPGNRQLAMDVFYPKEKSKRKRIALVIVHGGGWRTGNRTQHYPLAQKLAALGYVCFTPEYRLSTEAFFPAAVYDLKAAIRWIRSNAASYNIDTSRIVAAGFSAGGELAAFLGVTGNIPLFEGTDGRAGVPTNVNAVVDMDGILSFTHPESGEGDDSKRTSAATYWFGYPKKGYEKIWETGSSLNYVSSSTPPTLFLNSSVDRMHAGREDYIKMLNGFNTYTEVHSFEGAPHGFPLFDPWFEPVVNYIDGFLKKIFP
jgi:pectinesterase